MAKPFKSIYCVLILGIVICSYSEGKMTMEQVQKAGEMMRSVCQPKFKVSDELVDGIKEGKFPNDRNLKCYSNCALEMMQSVKKGKVNYASTMKQIDLMMPDDLKDIYKSSVEICKDEGKTIKDNCDAAYEILQCFYKNNKDFMFP